jgi:hypothetical protein
MKKSLFVFVVVFLSYSLTVVAADTEGFFGAHGNAITVPSFDQIFARAKEQGGISPLFFQGLPASAGQPRSGVQALVDKFFSEDFEPTPYAELGEEGASGAEGEDNGDAALPFFSEPDVNQDSGGLDTFMGQNWLWSPGAYGSGSWFNPEGWGSTGQLDLAPWPFLGPME